MSESANAWYILHTDQGTCEIVTAEQLAEAETGTDRQQWGPFASQQDAIARRVGLIRSGKCKPA